MAAREGSPAKDVPAKSPPQDDDKKKNNVRVSANKSKFVYADVSKHLLNDGEAFVELSALGAAIADCVAVVEMLKNQGMVTVKKIETSRGVLTARRATTDKISITVVKSKEFDAKYKEQQAQRETRKAEAAAEKK
jgi:DNA-binding protein